MDILDRASLGKVQLRGRVLQRAVGRDGPSYSARMTVGFTHYSAESGPMIPHRHAEETVYVVSADRGRVRYGPTAALGCTAPLRTGMTLHIPEGEWHVFEYGEGGHVDIVFIYGQTDNVRPEEAGGSY